MSFYAVAFGHKSGVYDTYEDMKRYTKGFPQAIHKKFSSKDAAEKFVRSCRPQSQQLDVDHNSDKFFSVPRGRVVGIFANYDDVKKSHKDYPKEAKMHKRFPNYDAAKEYFDKFSKIETENFDENKEERAGELTEEHEENQVRTKSPVKSAKQKESESSIKLDERKEHDSKEASQDSEPSLDLTTSDEYPLNVTAEEKELELAPPGDESTKESNEEEIVRNQTAQEEETEGGDTDGQKEPKEEMVIQEQDQKVEDEQVPMSVPDDEVSIEKVSVRDEEEEERSDGEGVAVKKPRLDLETE